VGDLFMFLCLREEIIAPLLRQLGYRSGTPNSIIREQALSYSQLSLGRKKKHDPILRGRADYICDVQGKVKWVIEAKAPAAALDKDADEQAWSYANHPEIRALYYCLSNGREFQI
jgi:predicted type IV restriction endonuclease